MKKIVFILLAAVVICTMTVIASADQIDSESIDIPANYTDGSVTIVGPDGSTTTATVYSVTLEWTGIDGVAYAGAQTVYYWDAAALTYVQHTNSTQEGWTDANDSFTVTVTNRSNSGVVATAAFNAAENIGASVECEFEGNGATIASAAPTQAELKAGTLAGSAKTGSITGDLTATGTLDSDVTSVGTITITIEPNE